MLYNNMIFNDRTLNIFTDASIRKEPNGEYTGCAGTIVINGNSIYNTIDTQTRIIGKSTSNNSEMHAINLGIQAAIKYREELDNITSINLFSDSKVCIFGLREWMFSWVENSQGTALIGSTGEQVSNQDIILEVVYRILREEVNINLYHQKGHVSLSKENSLINAKEVFIKSNNIIRDVDYRLIENISIVNNEIDRITREELNSRDVYDSFLNNSIVTNIYTDFDIDKYAKLLNVI